MQDGEALARVEALAQFGEVAGGGVAGEAIAVDHEGVGGGDLGGILRPALADVPP